MKDHTDDPTRLDTYNKSNVKNKVKNFYYQSFTIGNSENRLKFDQFPPFIQLKDMKTNIDQYN